jgi:hypothetical protein
MSPAPSASAAPAPAEEATEDAGSEAQPTETKAEEVAPGPIPTECASTDPCVPDAGFVTRLCGGNFPDVALVLMGSPAFTHMFMRADVDGWNADSGRSTRARLAFDEDVLVLRRRAPASGGIVVGAGASFLVMRWDGNCYTLDEGELTAKKPPAAKPGPIPWRILAVPTRDALLKSSSVLAAFQRRGKECQGASSGEVSRACEQADRALSAAIVAEVRGGLAIPTPDHRP